MMKQLFSTKVLLVAIVIIAAVLRFYQIGSNPPSMSWDEVAWGYNAYSLGIDARDEFGKLLPHDYIESFGDFKPVMYAYLAVLPVKAFGLTVFATRFPSAFLGTLTVLLTYFLTIRIFQGFKKKEDVELNSIGLLAAFFLAISPWHIMLSRGAWEANVATFFLVTGIWLYLKAVQENMWYLSLSAIGFIASLYAFNTSRVFTPLILVALSLLFWKQLWQHKKQAVIAGIIGILFLLPTLPHLLSPQAKLRFQEVNIFSDSTVVKMANQEVANDNNVSWSKIIHNRRFLYSLDFLQHYFDNLNFRFLFIQGDGNPKFSIQDVGQMYLWDLPFFIAGILYLFRKKEGNWWVVPLWILLGIIPAAIARETPHALRIETTLPTFQIFVAYGFVEFALWLKKSIKIVLTVLGVILFLNILYFQVGYYTHYVYEYSHEWQYGYSESIVYVSNMENKYDEIHITETLGRPYIYYLFYTRTNPDAFRKSAKIYRDAFGFVDVTGFGKYVFQKQIHAENHGKRVLYINIASDLPDHANILKSFPLINGEPNLVAWTL